MRRKITLYLIRTSNRFVLNRIKAIELSVITKRAARAFGVSKPKASKDPLESFAVFTKEASIYGNPQRIYDEFYQLGKSVRKLTGLTDSKELEELIFFLYKNIEIELHGSIDDEIWISPCYFSKRYTPDECAMMSNMDSGIVTGIYGGKKLAFKQRITEGCRCCKAFIEREINDD